MNYKILLIALLLATGLYSQNFEGSFDLIVLQETESGIQHGDTISYYFAEDQTAILIHARGNQPDLRLIFKVADSTITGLFENKGIKGGYVLPMNEKYWPAMDYALRDYETETALNYSGEEKEIAGYLCSEIICDDEEFEIRVWATNEIDLSFTQILAYQTVGAGKDLNAIEMFSRCGIQSFAMNTQLMGLDEKGTVTIDVKNLTNEVDSSIFSTEGHEIGIIEN